MQPSDRIKAALEAFITRVMERVRYLPLLPSRVSQQDSDNTLQVTPDDTKIPGLTGVPIRTFVPGATIKVNQDARVLVGFEGGDPSRPVAFLFQGDAAKLKELVLENADNAKISWKQGGNVEITAGSTKITVSKNSSVAIDAGSNDVTIDGGTIKLKGGSTPVAKEGSQLQGSAGPYPIAGVVQVGQGSANVKVP